MWRHDPSWWQGITHAIMGWGGWHTLLRGFHGATIHDGWPILAFFAKVVPRTYLYWLELSKLAGVRWGCDTQKTGCAGIHGAHPSKTATGWGSLSVMLQRWASLRTAGSSCLASLARRNDKNWGARASGMTRTATTKPSLQDENAFRWGTSFSFFGIGFR
jgi:hypothetical protein